MHQVAGRVAGLDHIDDDEGAVLGLEPLELLLASYEGGALPLEEIHDARHLVRVGTGVRVRVRVRVGVRVRVKVRVKGEW